MFFIPGQDLHVCKGHIQYMVGGMHVLFVSYHWNLCLWTLRWQANLYMYFIIDVYCSIFSFSPFYIHHFNLREGFTIIYGVWHGWFQVLSGSSVKNTLMRFNEITFHQSSFWDLKMESDHAYPYLSLHS